MFQQNQIYMAEDDGDNQEKPLTPAPPSPPPRPPNRPPITVDEALSTELKKQHQGFRKRTLWCGIVTAVILVLAVVMLVLAFTVFHVKKPIIVMNSVLIGGFDGVNVLAGRANLTVVADVSVKNPNVAAFRFEKSNSSLWYYDTVIGVAEVPGGTAKARRTMRMNLTFEVTVPKITGNQHFAGDLLAGVLPVRSYTKINGRVKITKLVKKNVTVTMNCSVDVNVTNWGIVRQKCDRHISF